jgi:hypothetical protein
MDLIQALFNKIWLVFIFYIPDCLVTFRQIQLYPSHDIPLIHEQKWRTDNGPCSHLYHQRIVIEKNI